MKIIEKNYIKRIEDIIYEGNKINHIEHSLYQVEEKKIMMMIRENDKDNYFFGMNEKYLEIVEEVIFICGKELIAFRIPAKVINSLPMYGKKNGDRVITSIIFDYKANSWYLTFMKDEEGKSELDIDNYLISLKNKEEILCESQAIKSLLNI